MITKGWAPVEPASSACSIQSLKLYAKKGLHQEPVARNIQWLIECCLRYKHNFQSPALALNLRPTLSAEDKAAFFKLYDSLFFSYINDTRGLSKWNLCPYCGLRNAISLDHYLPRRVADFPHLSFLSLNLVPACDDCQSKKKVFFPQIAATGKVRWVKRSFGNRRASRIYVRNKVRVGRRVRIANVARIMHPYLDSEIDLRKIKVEFDLDPQLGPYNFRLRYSGSPRSRQSELLAFHVSKLELNQRLLAPLRKEWDSLIPYLRDAIEPKAELGEVRRQLLAIANKKFSKSGVFSMEYKFIHEVAQSEQCMRLLLSSAFTTPANRLKSRSRCRYVA